METLLSIYLQILTCQAAVAWAKDTPLVIETIEVDPPKAGEVRVKLTSAGVCDTDSYFLSGASGVDVFPVILGHEGAGIVESVGDGVIEFKTGDHVIPLHITECKEFRCRVCKNDDSNLCVKVPDTQKQGLMTDGTSRFRCKGKALNHFMGCSTFSEYTVVWEQSLVKINDKAPLEKVCLFGCCIPAGYGAVVNMAGARAGRTCAVWGLGAIGLAVVMGCKRVGVSKIIGIDTNGERYERARKLGCTEFINPKDFVTPLSKYIQEMTAGGLDYSFVCPGMTDGTKAALESLLVGGGVSVVIGESDSFDSVSFSPTQLLGRIWKGSVYGGFKPYQIPQLVDDLMNNESIVDDFISHTMKLDKINEAFDYMRAGKSTRSIIHFF